MNDERVLYAVVAFWEKSGTKIVADYPRDQDAACRALALQTIDGLKPSENDRTTVDGGKYVVHVLIGELHYACLTKRADQPSSTSRLESCSQVFLERLRSVYRELPILADLSTDLANLSSIDLSAPLKKIVEEHNNYKRTDYAEKMPQLEDELAEIRNILMDGVQKLIDRGQRLDDLIEKTHSLQITTRKNFHVLSRTPSTKKNVLVATIAATFMFMSTTLFIFLLYVGFL